MVAAKLRPQSEPPVRDVETHPIAITSEIKGTLNVTIKKDEKLPPQ